MSRIVFVLRSLLVYCKISPDDESWSLFNDSKRFWQLVLTFDDEDKAKEFEDKFTAMVLAVA